MITRTLSRVGIGAVAGGVAMLGHSMTLTAVALLVCLGCLFDLLLHRPH